MPPYHIFSLCFTTFFLSLHSFFFLSFLLLSCRGLFPLFGLAFPGSLSLGAYYSLTMGSLPLSASPIGSSSFGVFFSLFHVFVLLPFFPPPLPSPFFLPWLPPFYSELIQWDFSLLPLELYQLFLVCCEHPFKITHPPIGCPYHCSEYVSCTITYFMTKFSFFCSCCIPLPLGD